MIELLPDRQVMKEPLKGDFGREFLMNDTFYRRVHARKRPLECRADPIAMGNCHCRDRQRVTRATARLQR